MKKLFYSLCAALILMLAIPFSSAAQERRPPSGGSSGGGGQVAAPRGGSGGGQPSGGGQHSAPPPSAGARRGGDSGGSYGTAPSQGRPRGERPVYGQATPRSTFGGGRIIVPSRYYGYSPWYYYSPYAFGAFGLGYWGWDPYWWGYYPGYWGSPYGYGYGRYYGDGYYGGGYYGGGYYRDRGYEYGSLKLKVKPKEAEVYVDGYYMGQVEDFDGVFQHLDLESGTHKIEIRAEGYQPLVFEMRVAPGRTVKYEGQLRR